MTLVVENIGALYTMEPAGESALGVVEDACVLVEDGRVRFAKNRAGVDELAAVLGRLLADRDRLASMARAARRRGRAGAAGAIADRVEHLGGKH